jgi:hypothetical protein
MFSLAIKNFILAVLIALILHFLLKNHMIEINYHNNIEKKESFVTKNETKNETKNNKSILKKTNDATLKSTIAKKSVKFDKNIESYNNFDLGRVYNSDSNADLNVDLNVDLNNKKIKDDLYEFVFNKQAEFGDSSIDSFSIQGDNNLINEKDNISGMGSFESFGTLESIEKETIINESNNDLFIDKKADEIFDGITGYRESENFSIL